MAIGLAVTLSLALLVVVMFSTEVTSYECTGLLRVDGPNRATPLLVRIERYRPWVGWWSDSYGKMRMEIPDEWFGQFSHIEEAGGDLILYRSYPSGTSKGFFSRISGALTVDIGFGVFEGQCKNIE